MDRLHNKFRLRYRLGIIHKYTSEEQDKILSAATIEKKKEGLTQSAKKEIDDELKHLEV